MKKYYLYSLFMVILIVIVFGVVGAAFALVYPYKYTNEIRASAEEYDIDPALVASIINVESGYVPTKVSPVGAIGLMQLMPTTAVEIATKKGIENFDVKSLYEPAVNIDFGCYYLKYLLNIYDGNVNNVLASYNAGLNKVNTWLLNEEFSTDGVVIIRTPYKETNDFINKVNANYKIYSKKIS